ncbi:MAG TPA: CofH family radical SAM protein, partial [Phycisphaerae bacterium]|nr:CofH family radical SAM protein [Phycisphaerae bacterium]
TNFCVLRCKFCSFYRPYSKNHAASDAVKDREGSLPLPLAGQPAESDTYELGVDEIVERARQAYQAGATEAHIVGGLHPKLPFSYYLDMCRAIREACPRIHIKAFTAIEIIHFTRISKPRLSIAEVLTQLRQAGLDSMPGGGAEIFDDRVHDEAYQNKVGEQGWFDVHRTAHELGIFTNATMLYGHVERPEERIGHMIKLRDHQDESLASRRAAFNCFIPLSFIPEGSELDQLPGPTGFDDLRTLAISRLMLDNVPHIKAFWIMQSAKLAQVSLNFGVDDLDGTVVWYDITKREGGAGRTHQELTVERMRRLIAEAGRTPVERDTLYRPVRRDGARWELIAGS